MRKFLTTFAIFVAPFLVQAAPVLSVPQEDVVLEFTTMLLDPFSMSIRASLFPPDTDYWVEVSRQDMDRLGAISQKLLAAGLTLKTDENISREEWIADIGDCGSWAESDEGYYWHHPEELCAHDEGTDHSGTINVSGEYTVALFLGKDPSPILNAAWSYRCSYVGSESGEQECEVKLLRWIGVNSPIGVGPNENAEDTSSRNQNKDILWWGLLLAVSVFGMYVFQKEGSADDPCDDEKKRERTACTRKEMAEKTFQELDHAMKIRDEAGRQAAAEREKAESAKKAAGTRWQASGATDWEGVHTEIQREGWHDKEKGDLADSAEARARDAEANYEAERELFDRRGGKHAHEEAKRLLDEAVKEWENAKYALKVCLQTIPAETIPVVSSGVRPSSESPLTETKIDSQTATTIVPPAVCVAGGIREVSTRSHEFLLLDLSSVKLMQDKIYSDHGNEAMKFVDYLQSMKDTFFFAKKIKGGIDAYLSNSVEGVSDVAGLPDFFTFYDEAGNMLTQSMHKLATVMEEKQQLGTYWLEYSCKRIKLTCTVSEICMNGTWASRSDLRMEVLGLETRRTDPQEVHDIRELQPTIKRLFTQLRNRYNGERLRAEAMSKECR